MHACGPTTQAEPSTSADLSMLETAVAGARAAGVEDKDDEGIQNLIAHVRSLRIALGLGDPEALGEGGGQSEDRGTGRHWQEQSSKTCLHLFQWKDHHFCLFVHFAGFHLGKRNASQGTLTDRSKKQGSRAPARPCYM